MLAVALIANGVPMTLEGGAEAQTLEPGAMGTQEDGKTSVLQVLSCAARSRPSWPPSYRLGTNGGGFFGANSAHPFENLGVGTNFPTCMAIILLPGGGLIMFGRMLNQMRHAGMIFGVMLLFTVGTVAWAVYHDTSYSPAPQPSSNQAERTKDKDGIEVGPACRGRRW